MNDLIEMGELPILIFAKSLAIGLLIGAERERHVGNQAGLRTFGLIAVFGTLCGLLADKTGGVWILAIGMLAITAMMVVAYARGVDRAQESGTTSTVAALLCFGFGALLWYDESSLAVTLALTTTVLLYFKSELEAAVERLSKQDQVSFLQFAAITFMILPMLPDRGFGPYSALNPYRIWLMVVLISGIGLAGYAVLRIAGTGRALPLMGVLGGLVSSTATTLAYSRTSRTQQSLAEGCALVILVANLMTLVRLTVVSAIVAPALLRQIGPMLAAGIVAGLWVPISIWVHLAKDHQRPDFQVGIPTAIRTAVFFALMFALVLLATAWLNDHAGTTGVYIVAGVSGLTDVDPITLSVLKLFGENRLAGIEVCLAIMLAFASNSVFKLGVVIVTAAPAVRRKVGLGYLTTLAGLALAWIALKSFSS